MKHASFSIGNHCVYMLHLEPDHLKVTFTCYRWQSRKFAKLASLPSYAIFVYLFMYLSLCWVFVAARRLSPLSASRSRGSSLVVVHIFFHWGGFSCCRAQAVGAWSSVALMHRLSCFTACVIFLDQESSPCPLYWQARNLSSLIHFLSQTSLEVKGCSATFRILKPSSLCPEAPACLMRCCCPW